MIADCQFPVSAWQPPIKPIDNGKSEIGNPGGCLG